MAVYPENRRSRALPGGAALLAALAVLSPYAASRAMAAQSGSSASGLGAAKKQVVSLFHIPAYYKLTQESFNKGPGGHGQYSFSFNYSSPDNQNRWTNVSVDAVTGTVLNYSGSSTATGFVYPLPVSAAKAKQIALSWAKKLYPQQLPNVQIQPQSGYPGALTQPVSYTFNFTRVMNGIPAPFDGFSLTIDQNGQLTGANDSWSSTAFPKANGFLTAEAADGVYQRSLHLYLGYTTVWNGNASAPTPYLTYQPPGQQYGGWNQPFESDSIGNLVIDAKTGKLLDTSGNVTQAPVFTPPVPVVKGGPTVYPGSGKVDWSEAQALAYAQSALVIPTGYHLTNTNQNQTFPSGDVTWNFTWSDASSHQIAAGVDATRGTLTNYNTYLAPPAPHTKATQAGIEAAATAFLKRLFPHDTGGLAIVATKVQPIRPGMATAVDRMLMVEPIVNGVPVLTDTAQLMVEGTTDPKVVSYWSNFLPSVSGLPSPAKAIPATLADTLWMNNQPLQLEYLLTQPPWDPKHKVPQRVVLVYAPQINPFAFGAALNAVTGQFVNNNANQQPYTGVIQDLKDVPDADQIQLLVSHGLLSVDARGDVHPDAAMTRAQFVKLVVDALGLDGGPIHGSFGGAMQMSAASPAYNAVAAAFAHGWLQSGQLFHPNQPITRGDAAQILVRALGYAGVLQHPEIFTLPVQDTAQIPKDQRAGDAIAYALGMMPLVGGDFDGSAHVTVAQAAVAIVQMVTAYSEGQQIFDFGASGGGAVSASAPAAAP